MDDDAPPKILVVDDDPKVRSLLRRCFEQERYAVVEAADGVATRRQLSEQSFDLITLDLSMPGEDGLTLARDIRARSGVPIVMITGKGEMIDTVVGLELGADDYIAKPFHVREVLARVRSVLRRSGRFAREFAGTAAPRSATLRFDRWEIDFDKRELRDRGGEICALTTAEFDLLRLFVENRHRVLTRERIMDLLKGRDWAPFDRAIDTQVGRLRRKIEDDPANPTLIKTVRGAGYLFSGDIEPV